jgi:glycosyltransferase involved in cell wall biosynthesis
MKIRPRVLHLARAYPNNVLPTQGLWTQRHVQISTWFADPAVIAPVPYAPPGLPQEAYARYRRVFRMESDAGVTVRRPRVLTAPGNLLISFSCDLAYHSVRRLADRLHAEQPFDLIHAHFIHPEGVMAARLGERYGVPVISTEQALWEPMMAASQRIRRQVLGALPGIATVTAVSEAGRESIRRFVGDGTRIELLPNVVDEETFQAPAPENTWDPDQLLFVGVVRRVKGLDVLVHAMAQLRTIRPTVKLKVVGAPFFASYQKDEMEVRALISSLDLNSYVEFAGQASPTEVAAAMRQSALVVSPSRRESFSAVLIEALASGTPVVATRSGGPDEYVTEAVGRLVPPEDPGALAEAIDEMLTLRPSFEPARLREYILSRYGVAAVGARLQSIYDEVLHGAREGAPSPA